MTSPNTFLQGVGLRVLAIFVLTAMSAAVRAASETVPVGQIMFWRSALALIPICLYMMFWRRDFPQALRTRRPGMHIVRSTLGAFAMAMAFLSLAYLPVANAQALSYLAPVLVLPLAGVFLRERMGAAVFIGMGLGLSGVLLLLWDAFQMPGDGAVIGVVAGLAFAMTMAVTRVLTKRMTETEQSSTIAFYFSVIAALAGLATWPFGWAALDWTGFGWLVLAGGLGGIGQIAMNEATARAPVSQLAPFDFTGLVWALGFDLVLFAVVPGWSGLIGVVAITLAGLVVTRAETSARA